ncbi:MAG: CoA transferase [Chloroflexi bacterium]|nr:CoA transferase [Chloroflexota bacterium]
MSPPLEGLRIVAIEQYGAGPFGTMQLAELGADVVKIEDPSVGGDVSRYIPPFAEGTSSLFFESFNRGKRSVLLDLRHEGSREVLEDLVRGADAVFSNLRGDGPARLRIRYSDLQEVNPAIVCVSLSGFGQTGPRAGEGAYDYTVQGLAGWQSVTGDPAGPPTKSGLSLVDFCGGYVAALTILAGVTRARRDGVGGDADLSLFEVALAQLTYLGTWVASRSYEPVRRANSAHQSIVPFQNFETSDGWIVVACPKETLWRRLCVAIDRPELADEPTFATFAARDRNREALGELLSSVFASRTTEAWLDRLEGAGVPCARVNDIAAALADPQLAARGGIAAYSHPVLGEVRTPASPLRLTPDDGPGISRGPLLGEHTDAVLRELCAYDDERIEALGRAGVLG